MSTKKRLGWILIASAAALAVASGMVVARRFIAQGRSSPSRIIDGCNRMLSDLERRLQGRASGAPRSNVEM